MSSFLQPRSSCTEIGPGCPIEKSFYGYSPSLAPDVVLLVLFSLALIANAGQGIYYRAWSVLTAMVWGCICEVLGYAGRLMMHPNAFNLNGFLIQICCLTIAPAFFSAAIYLCLSRIVVLFGPEVAHLSPKTYAYIFIGCDIISLALQGAGGALASIAAQKNTSLVMGDNVQLAGLSFQVGSLTIFGLCCAEYAWQIYRSRDAMARVPVIFRANKGLKLFMYALGLSYTLILIRCIYRVIELSNGWGSTLMKNQNDFIVLEGVMIILAVLTLNAFHPGKWLYRAINPLEARKTLSASSSDVESIGATPKEGFAF